jgi:dienelactone hydrolase
VIVQTQKSQAQIIRKTTVDFYSRDSLLITADLYVSKAEDPFILLLHHENASRGEYDSIAHRFVKMRFNCLSVDLRVGDSYNFVNNKTAARAKEKNIDTYRAVERDIEAAISYISNHSGRDVVLLGSSLSATLALKAASDSDKVGAVMAFSPGEFLRPEHSLESIMEKVQVPVYVTGSSTEYPYLLRSIGGLSDATLTLFEPPENTMERGVQVLMEDSLNMNEYWFSVLIFMRSLKI